MRCRLVGSVLAGLACAPTGRDLPIASAKKAAPPPAPQSPDTMLFVTADGYQVWFAEGRWARDSAGTQCYERSVEVRKGTTKIKVPLFFTNRPPRQDNPGSLRGELMFDCRVMAIYRIDLATGRPTKVADR